MSSIDRLFALLNDDAPAGTEKTAAAAAPVAAPASVDPILATVQALTSKSASDAAASAPAALPSLDKMASDLAAAETDAFVAQSKLAGAAFCDSFMARLSGYDTQIGAKTASAVASNVDLEKIAAEAYAMGVADSEKRAADDYQAGFDETVQELHKTAAEIHIAGQQCAARVLSEMTKAASASGGAPTRPFVRV